MTENDIELNISKLKTVKVKVIAKTSINFLAQHIEKAIKHPEFFNIDYEKFGKDIINNANISQNEKNKIHEMFKNPLQKDSQHSNCNNPQINKSESANPPPNLHPIIAEMPRNTNPSNDKKVISNNIPKNIIPSNDKKVISNDIPKNVIPSNDKKSISNNITKNDIPNNDKKVISNNITKNANPNNDKKKISNNVQININLNSNNKKLSMAPIMYFEVHDNSKKNNERNDTEYNDTECDDTEYDDTEYLDLNLFDIQEKIYKGDYTSIFKIREKSTNKIYAAKKVRSNIRRYIRNKILDFAQEVNMSLKLNHPSIIKSIGYGSKKFKNDLKQVIIFDYAPNKSLDMLFDSIRNNQKIMEWNDTKKLINIYGIAASMSFLHSNKIIHCNLQPNNILLDKNFYPKICDFESSKKITRENQMNDSFLRGSPAYIAPEVYSGLNYSKSSDVYSFAFIVYELMTNEKPYNNIKDGFEIMKTACKNKIRPKFQNPIDENYRKLIEKCWSDNPDDRPTFSYILSQLETNQKFITKNIDKEEYYKYIKYIKESEKRFDSSAHVSEFDDYISKNSDNFISNSIKDNTKDLILEPFELENDLINRYNYLLEQNINDNRNEDEDDNDSEDIILGIKDISRNEVINFCNETNVLIKINHFTLDKYARENKISLANIDYYNRSFFKYETPDYKYKYEEMWDVTNKLILMYGIAAGMKYLHSHNILHRDLKPFNVIDYKMTPHIRGFDLSIMLNNKDNKIKVNEIKGTAAYLAPEVYLKKEYSEKSDVYSYALLIYEILTEKKPFEGYSNAIEIKEEICDKQHRPEFDQPINKTYRQLIERCWSQNPEDRPTFSEIVTELETNDKFITYQVDKKSYMKYINFIKGLKSRFYAEHKIQKLENYIAFQHKNFTDDKININLSDAFSTETTNIDYSNHVYFNVNNYEIEKNICDRSNYSIFLVKNKERGNIYAAKTPYYTINGFYQHQFVNFFNELNVIMQLDHPSILKFIGFSPIGYNKSKTPLIVTEYASNGPLSNYIIPNNRFKPQKFSETNKIIILYGVAAAMKDLHSHNILHRDIKTENIFLDSSLHPKIAGFDISIMLNNKDNKIKVNEIKGTAAYLAPEVYLKKEYSEKSDVYSYALLIYEILTEKKPFEGYSNAIEIKEEICDKQHRPEFDQPINKTYRQLIEIPNIYIQKLSMCLSIYAIMMKYQIFI